MFKKCKKISIILSLFIILVTISGCTIRPTSIIEEKFDSETMIEENGEYQSKEEVAKYIHIYKKLPSNYVTKSEAKKWVGQTKGHLMKFCQENL